MTNETTASQPKSIGDDAQFLDLMTEVTCATEELSHTRPAAWAALVAYIHGYFRAPAAQASATIQAAPEGWRDKLRWSKANTDYHGLTAFTPDQLEHFVSMLCAPAATIQEPVMAAEPVYQIGSPCGRYWKTTTKNTYDSTGPNWRRIRPDAAPMVADPAGVVRLTPEQIFETADPFFIWDADDWRKATSGSIGMPGLLAYTRAALAATVKAVPSEALDEAPIECWSADQEDFAAQSIGELFDRNEELKPGDTVWVGEAVKPEPSQLIDADDIVTMMGERADDLVGEHADGYPDVDKEAEQELNTLLAGWIGKHARPNFWTVTNVKPYVLSADDFAAPLAGKTGGGE